MTRWVMNSSGVGLRKEDTLLLDKLNGVLKDMSDDGTLTKLSQKWFNEDIYSQSELIQ